MQTLLRIVLTLTTLNVLCAAGIEKVQNPSEARPRKVVAEVDNANTIKLTWQPPRIADNNACPVKRYLIRLRNEGGKRSKTWKIDGARHSLSLHDLLENTDYSIRLMAVTCEGKGARTRWITVTTGGIHRPESGDDWEEQDTKIAENRVPGKPLYVRTRTYSDSVILSWQPPENEVIVRGYKVGYSEGVPDLNWRYVDASVRNITISNLKPASQYVVSLCAFNNYGEGEVEYELIYTRENSGPTTSPLSPPENVRAKVLSANTAWLQWHDPSLGRSQQFTDDRYYNVHYQSLPNGKQLSMIVKAMHVVLYDLVPGTTYSFKVRTVKEAHASPFSESVRNKTFETKPDSAPRSLTVISTNDSSTIHLSWRTPRQPNGYITAYLVLYTPDQKQPVSTWEIFAVQGANTQVVMSTLKPNTTYYFKVQAKNSQGYGPTSNTLVYHTTAMYVDSMSDNDVFKPSPDEELPVVYEHMYEEGNALDGDEDDDMYDALYDNGKFEAQVKLQEEQAMRDAEGSDSLSMRSARVKHPTMALDSAYSDKAFTGSSLDVTFQSVVKHTVSAIVTWRLPCYDTPKAGPVKYMVRYYAIDTPDIYTDKSTPTDFVQLDNLRPNVLYKYKVKRMTPYADESEWSREGLLDTNYPGGET